MEVYVTCQQCHETYMIRGINTPGLLFLYCTEACAIQAGFSQEVIHRLWNKRVTLQDNRIANMVAEIETLYEMLPASEQRKVGL